jgi:hypothetical protein
MMGKWESVGTSCRMDGTPASAGSHAVYYKHSGTGDYCSRFASWGDHGFGSHGFRAGGPGWGCDQGGNPNGKKYDPAEF